MKKKHQRLIKIAFFLFLISFGFFLIINSFKENLIYFYSPTDIYLKENSNKIINKKIRVGGLVKKGSINKNGNEFNFIITDNAREVAVLYRGFEPPMFKDLQGVVAEGDLILENNKIIYFMAEKLITKHDENYMPPEVKKSLKK